jgi:hypothetical protein
MMTVSGLQGVRQAPCALTQLPPSGTGLLECNWSSGYQLSVPQSWVSGLYIARLINSEGYGSTIPFVVRDDLRAADYVYQHPTTTYQAYNRYTNGLGKVGLYEGSYEASFDRPYEADGGLLWAYNMNEPSMISWLEMKGYDVSYSTNVDIHRVPRSLLKYKAFISAGHDEYWTRSNFDAVELARNYGVHLAFFGANTAYWQMRFRPSSVGVEDRIMIVYRNAATDPISDPSLKTILWRNLGRPEQSLIGVQFGNGAYAGGSFENVFPLIVSNSSHWIYAGAGIANGYEVPAVVGQEWDSTDDLMPRPASLRYDIVSHSTPPGVYSGSSDAEAVVYESLSGAIVFGAGSLTWGQAMFTQPVVGVMTKNLLDKFKNTSPSRFDRKIVDSVINLILLAD